MTVADAWRNAFGHVRPGYDMLWQLRIHSLPQGKRYPESEADYVELLARHNAVVTAVLRDGAPCVLLVGLYPPGDLAAEAIDFLRWRD